jgi:hypothetical protein
LFEEAEAFRTRPDGTKKIFEGTGQYTFINISGVTGVGSFVAARKLGLITAFVRSLLNGDVVWYRKPDICVALIADTVADAHDIGWARERRRHRSHGGGKPDNCFHSKNHFVGLEELSEVGSW